MQPLEKQVRELTGLGEQCRLHPPPWPSGFRQLQCALKHLQTLIQDGAYPSEQIGIFSEEVSSSGSRHFFVDTYAGFVLSRAPTTNQNGSKMTRHSYKLFLEDRPCWLYFDLEFSKSANPNLNPCLVAQAFFSMLDFFFRETLGLLWIGIQFMKWILRLQKNGQNTLSRKN